MTETEEACELGRVLYLVALCIALSMYVLSFFSNLMSSFEQLSLSSFIRIVHQGTRFVYVGNQPPRMLYVTDGGVIDCTALVQLIRRRCRRILLVLAASDPEDDLGVLK